ncbi:hypothetical protein K461DRAFT_296497 [Myriangium duriaei CBS 260.36]|uniref:Autophagy-related protein 29 n=1 Tax=Myriangium duriaei CBS 260.36 TaxID=1168546 RepID=A0A9P4IYM9_9PEZI|nr:hypothetical protein K461DRAFT_296497 [Myriangium duriaei CBS 260.36]
MDDSRSSGRPHYTCLIRLPFPRGDFVDPPPVDWDATKDKALWKIISKAANSKDLDWPELSNRFEVSLPFLLQQAAWLYERHFAQMRAQMKKLGASNAPSPSPAQDAIAAVPTTIQRPGSRGSRAPSALSIHSKDSPALASGTLTSPIKPNAPTISRTPSTRTVTQSRYPSAQHDTRSFRSSFGSHRRPVTLGDITADSPSPPLAASPSSSHSSSSDDRPTHPSVAKSQVFRRPPDLRTISSEGDAESDDDDDDSSTGYLPFASRDPNSSDQAATIRRASAADRTPQLRQEIVSSPSSGGDPVSPRRVPSTTSPVPQGRATQLPRPAVNMRPSATAPHKGSRPSGAQHPSSSSARSPGPTDGALSPRRRAELLSGLTSKESSDGTPSMGSSFSDLDDASVTQSALEDALLSNFQNAPGASRMSTFSQALRSRYLPQ